MSDTSILPEGLNVIRNRLKAIPDIHPYVTAKGGVVLINGPFPMDEARAAKDFIDHAASDVQYLLGVVDALQAALGWSAEPTASTAHTKTTAVKLTSFRRNILKRLANGEVLVYDNRMADRNTLQLMDKIPSPTLTPMREAGWITQVENSDSRMWEISAAGRAAIGA